MHLSFAKNVLATDFQCCYELLSAARSFSFFGAKHYYKLVPKQRISWQYYDVALGDLHNGEHRDPGVAGTPVVEARRAS